MQIVSLSTSTLSSGQSAELRYRVTNNNLPTGDALAEISVTSSIGELTCGGECDPSEEIAPGTNKVFTARLTAGQVPAGQQRSGQVTITAKIGNGNPNDTTGQASRNITVRGPAAPPPQTQTVRRVSGQVINESNGDPVGGAYVFMTDSKGSRFETVSNASGSYTFNGTSDKPIAPGTLSIGAQKEEVEALRQLNASANQTITNFRLTLKIAADPSASPTAEATEDIVPTEDIADPTDSAAAAGPATNAASDEGGFGSWLVVLGGGLLVAFGVGGIVWVLMRRKEGDEGEGDNTSTGLRPAVPASGGGAYGGGYGGGDATRIVGAPMGGGMGDAPTMMHNRAPMDEFPDPYGAPMPSHQPPPPQPPTYGGGQQGWGDGGYGQPTQVGGYDGQPTQIGGYGNNAPGSGGGGGADGYGNAPGSGGGYGGGQGYQGGGQGGGQGGYGQQQQYGGERFDEPTGRYEPASGGGYQGGGGYGDAQGYGDDRGYGGQGGGGQGGGGQGGGSQGGGGYQDRGYDRGGYGQQGGYGDSGYDEQRGGYQGGGYEQGGGYDRVPEQRGGGYGGGGYDQQGGGGYHDEPNQGRARHGADSGGRAERDRRELGWLDD